MINAARARGVYLTAFLQPLAPWLDQPDVSDIMINTPGEVWVERLGGGMERHTAPGLTDVVLGRLATQIAAFSDQGVNRQNPLLSAILPDGARVQIVAPPATRGPMAIAIRKHVVTDLTLGDYLAAGALEETQQVDADASVEADEGLQALLDRSEIAAFLGEAVRAKKNIVISGGTSTGKTTFLNALVREVPEYERLILIEDTPEIQLRQPNAIGLVASRGGQGEANVNVEDLLQASLRLRPDRIILGELRGPEAFSFLRAVNSGHPGSITTVHADSPHAAMEQIALMVMQAGANLERAEIIDYIRSVVDVAVQLTRKNGRRIVSKIFFASGLRQR